MFIKNKYLESGKMFIYRQKLPTSNMKNPLTFKCYLYMIMKKVSLQFRCQVIELA